MSFFTNHRERYPIVKMKILIADIYINILNLLQQITNYLSSNPISKFFTNPRLTCLTELIQVKLLDATFALGRYDFSINLDPIERAKGKIEDLFQICHVADGKSVKVTLDRTATGECLCKEIRRD